MNAIEKLNNNRIWAKHGVTIAWIISLVVFVTVVAHIGYSEYLSQQHRAADQAPQKLAPISRSSGPTYRVADITSANLFGDPTPKKVVTQNIRETNLNLKLVGVLWASNQKNARVIIQNGNKKAALYGVGDNINGANASVKEILASEILINRNGATEKLALVKKDSKDIISYVSSDISSTSAIPAAYNSPQSANTIGRTSNNKPISPNGENRKVRKPNFSGLDRALKKMNEL